MWWLALHRGLVVVGITGCDLCLFDLLFAVASALGVFFENTTDTCGGLLKAGVVGVLVRHQHGVWVVPTAGALMGALGGARGPTVVGVLLLVMVMRCGVEDKSGLGSLG